MKERRTHGLGRESTTLIEKNQHRAGSAPSFWRSSSEADRSGDDLRTRRQAPIRQPDAEPSAARYPAMDEQAAKTLPGKTCVAAQRRRARGDVDGVQDDFDSTFPDNEANGVAAGEHSVDTGAEQKTHQRRGNSLISMDQGLSSAARPSTMAPTVHQTGIYREPPRTG